MTMRKKVFTWCFNRSCVGRSLSITADVKTYLSTINASITGMPRKREKKHVNKPFVLWRRHSRYWKDGMERVVQSLFFFFFFLKARQRWFGTFLVGFQRSHLLVLLVILLYCSWVYCPGPQLVNWRSLWLITILVLKSLAWSCTCSPYSLFVVDSQTAQYVST